MQVFDLKVIPIYSYQELENNYKNNIKYDAKEFMLESNNRDYTTSLKTKLKDVQVSDLLALDIIASYKSPKIKEKDWTKAQFEYFSDEFGRSKIISIKTHTHDNSTHTHILICPIHEYKISADDFLINGQIRKEKTDAYKRKMNLHFFFNHNQPEEIEEVKERPKYGYSNDENEKETIYDILKFENNIQTSLPKHEINRIFKEVLKYFTQVEKRMYREAQYGKIPPDIYMAQVEKHIKTKYSIPQEDIKVILDKMYNAIFEYYVLERLINDDNISDIKVVAPDKIRVKYRGKRMTSNLFFVDLDDYLRFIDGVVIRNRTNTDPDNAVQNFTDKTSNENFILRFNLCTEYVNSVEYPYLHIRKVNKTKYTMWDLIDANMLSEENADYLIEKVRTGKGFVITGKGGCGKTSLMNTLIEYIPYWKSGLFIQENEELFSLDHPELMFQHIVTPRDGGIGYNLKDLTRNALLCDQDVIGIGEVKGDEALYLLNAVMTGAQGWCSVHSYDAESAIDKLADYIKYASDYPKTECIYMLKELEVLIFMKNFKIYEIKEITGWDSEQQKLIFKDIYKYNPSAA